MLTVIDEFTRRCMAVVVERRLNSDNVLHCLTELFVQHGPPDHIRSDNGSEFTAHAVRDWRGRIGVKTLYPRFPIWTPYRRVDRDSELLALQLACVLRPPVIRFHRMEGQLAGVAGQTDSSAAYQMHLSCRLRR